MDPGSDSSTVFNYWEPLHYLYKGYGFQTWENSPQYAIRSWAYALFWVLPSKVLFWVLLETGKVSSRNYHLRKKDSHAFLREKLSCSCAPFSGPYLPSVKPSYTIQSASKSIIAWPVTCCSCWLPTLACGTRPQVCHSHRVPTLSSRI